MSGLQHFDSQGGDMSKVVQIIAGKSVPYTINNVKPLEFDDGQFYEVPDWVAKNMIDRKWARLATDEDIAKIADGDDGGQPGQGDKPADPKPPPVQEPGKEPPKPQPDENDDDDKGEDAKQALRTKGKRRS
jgi:hypothetical protein